MLAVNVTVGNHQGQDHPYASRAADKSSHTSANHAPQGRGQSSRVRRSSVCHTVAQLGCSRGA